MDYQPLPLDLVANLSGLPFPVYLQRDGHMVLYAMPGADLSGVATRSKAGLQVHVPASDASVMRRLLVVLLARALESRSIPVAERGRQVADFAIALLAPLFGREPSIDAESFGAAQAGVDLLTTGLAVDSRLRRAVVEGHAPGPATPGSRAAGEPQDGAAEARRHAARAVDGLACAIALATEVEPDRPNLDGISLLELGRGVAFRDLGLPRTAAGARAGVGRSRSGRGGSAAERGHPGLGVGLIAGALGAAPAWTSIVAGHHERLDGSGYPGGHRGTRLSRPVRIAGLADTFASLVTPAAWGHLRTADEAIGVLRLGTQARFGEDLVWALVRVLEAGELLPRAGTGVAATTH